MCFGGKVASPEAEKTKALIAQTDSLVPPPAPDMMDASVIQAQLSKKQQLAGTTAGRSSTFLTGPGGIGGPSSSISKDFILSKFRNGEQESKGITKSVFANLAWKLMNGSK